MENLSQTTNGDFFPNEKLIEYCESQGINLEETIAETDRDVLNEEGNPSLGGTVTNVSTSASDSLDLLSRSPRSDHVTDDVRNHVTDGM